MRTNKSLVVVLLVGLFALAVSSSALAWGGPVRVYRRTIVVAPVRPVLVKPIKLETIDVTVKNVSLDKTLVYAEVTDAKEQVLRVYLGSPKVVDKFKDQLTAGKSLQITGLRAPNGFIAMAIKADGKTVWVRTVAGRHSFGWMPAPHRFVGRRHIPGWPMGHRLGFVAKGACPCCTQPGKAPAQARPQAQPQTPAQNLAPADAPAPAPAEAPAQSK